MSSETDLVVNKSRKEIAEYWKVPVHGELVPVKRWILRLNCQNLHFYRLKRCRKESGFVGNVLRI